MIFSHVLYQLSYPATGLRRLRRRAPVAGQTPAPEDPARRQRVIEAGATGLEPATSDVTGRRSNQLNYTPAIRLGDYRTSLDQTSGRSRFRTCDPLLVRQVLSH